jgi:uncharacterized secreted protein with C-terminal beta-propeller domain
VFGPQIRTYPDFSGRTGATSPPTREEYLAAYEDLRRKNVEAIGRTSLADWVPYNFVKNGAAVVAERVACENYFVPTEATTLSGFTQLASFQLDKAETAQSVAILGTVDTVYANQDALVLAARAWLSPKKMIVRPENRKAPFVDFVPSTATYLHKFDLKSNPAQPAYVGSGWVPGNVLNQFSLDERDGVLRVATTEQRTVRTWISDDVKVRPFYNQFSVTACSR